MTGHRPFGELTKTLTADRRARVAAKAAALREVMTLEELRRAKAITQEQVAAALEVGQPTVARLEELTEAHVGNLRRYIEALGGTLEITARFPDESVVIEPTGERPTVEELRARLHSRTSIDPSIDLVEILREERDRR